MPVQKIKSGRIITVQASTYIGDKGIIFYDEDTPELRLSDGVTPGGLPFTGGGGTGTYVLVTATTTRLGGVKIGSNVSVSADGTISVAAPFSGSYNDLTDTPAPYVLNTATASTLGGIKIGSGLVAQSDGTVSAVATSTYVLNTATDSILGGIKVGSGLSITGDGTLSAIATSTYVLPVASTSTLGGIKIGANLSITPDGTLSATAASTGSGNTFQTIKVSGQTDIVASGTDILELIAGAGIVIETSATSTPYKSLTIVSSGFGNIDGGFPDSVYGGIPILDGGSP